jgi:hypothetical protein
LLGIQESISRTEERECFPENRGWEPVIALMPRIPFMAGASRHGEMHHAGQSAQAFEVTEFTDLQGDSKQVERSLQQAASVALPASWYAANFLALEMG